MIEPEIRTLVSTAKSIRETPLHASKPHAFYDIYEDYFSPLKDLSVVVLEVGVYQGESTKVFSRYFPSGKIVGIDLDIKSIDFSGYPNIVYEKANQTSADDLGRVSEKHAPDGYDIIIDDASHIGLFSLFTLHHVFHRLKPGGLYVVEDWPTGYLKDWPDGTALAMRPTPSAARGIPKELESHSGGMVGFVKQLVDAVAGEGPLGRLGRNGGLSFEYLHVYGGTAVLRKAR